MNRMTWWHFEKFFARKAKDKEPKEIKMLDTLDQSHGIPNIFPFKDEGIHHS
jgi:hypothetical protein